MEDSMGVISSAINISADPLSVFRVAREVEKFPDFMPDVKEVSVIERRDDGFSRTSWTARARVASINKNIKWIEDEWWDENSLSSKFELVEGDYKHYRGDWKFEPSDSGTLVTLNIDFDLGLPLIGPLIVKLLDKLVQNNTDGMLKAIKARVEGEADSN